ncbi:hypothetical protein BDQ12DRAFT_715410 [Crucibulum laeve]|uniref:Uncharacterized protein n=1 Tax=Crucibulum laeve TaxID=68775 RepID=A0A5C3LNT5_9AGAR|nr:hypothetical protein BDQ12DRAFT_715410 [Crucibulum laeve]
MQSTLDVPRNLAHVNSSAEHRRNHSPFVHFLPTEIIGDIFARVIRSYPDHAGTSWMNLRPPMTLSSVCVYWRTVALSMPALWSEISIYSPLPRYIPSIELFLERARDHPLTLYLHQSKVLTESEYQATESILRLFVSGARKWKSIDFFLSTTHSSLFILPQVLPILESAKVSLDTWNNDCEMVMSRDDSVWTALHSSPVLREVNWGKTYKERMPPNVPWHQLTRIESLPEMPISTLLDILALCSRIEHLEVHTLSSSDTPLQLPIPVVLGNLRCLKLNIGVDSDSADFFDNVDLPVLENLTIIHDYDFPFNHEASALNDCLLRSGTSVLKTFSLCSAEPSGQDTLDYVFAPVLLSVPDLQLSLSGIQKPDEKDSHFTVTFASKEDQIYSIDICANYPVLDHLPDLLPQIFASKIAHHLQRDPLKEASICLTTTLSLSENGCLERICRENNIVFTVSHVV